MPLDSGSLRSLKPDTRNVLDARASDWPTSSWKSHDTEPRGTLAIRAAEKTRRHCMSLRCALTNTVFCPDREAAHQKECHEVKDWKALTLWTASDGQVYLWDKRNHGRGLPFGRDSTSSKQAANT